MYFRHLRRLIWLTLFFSAAGYASAYYTMGMYITPPDFSESLNSTMDVRLINSGDEMAYKGTLQVMHPTSLKSDPITFGTMAPNVTNNMTVRVLADATMKPGTYPLVTSLEFMDGNNYPIYMIFETGFELGKTSTTKVYGTLSTAELPSDGQGTLTLKIKNMDEVPRTVKTRIFLPASLTADRTEEDVPIEPQGEAKVEYQISNFMALQDSNFMVLATIEYDDDTHHATIARGRVKVLASGQDNDPDYLLPAAAAVVVLCILGFGYWRLGGLGQMKRWLLTPGKKPRQAR
ncbi:MAG: hypothetical protein V1875_08085 [Candidatus Altiarchaeota archaeon]